MKTDLFCSVDRHVEFLHLWRSRRRHRAAVSGLLLPVFSEGKPAGHHKHAEVDEKQDRCKEAKRLEEQRTNTPTTFRLVAFIIERERKERGREGKSRRRWSRKAGGRKRKKEVVKKRRRQERTAVSVCGCFLTVALLSKDVPPLSEAKTMEAMRNNRAMPPVYKKSCRGEEEEDEEEEEEDQQLRTSCSMCGNTTCHTSVEFNILKKDASSLPLRELDLQTHSLSCLCDRYEAGRLV